MFAVEFAKLMGAQCIIDPFCGKGTVLAAANFLQLSAVGVELNPKVARKAQKLESNIFEGSAPLTTAASPCKNFLRALPQSSTTWFLCFIFLFLFRRGLFRQRLAKLIKLAKRKRA